jgi:hypothetical protein
MGQIVLSIPLFFLPAPVTGAMLASSFYAAALRSAKEHAAPSWLVLAPERGPPGPRTAALTARLRSHANNKENPGNYAPL